MRSRVSADRAHAAVAGFVRGPVHRVRRARDRVAAQGAQRAVAVRVHRPVQHVRLDDKRGQTAYGADLHVSARALVVDEPVRGHVLRKRGVGIADGAVAGRIAAVHRLAAQLRHGRAVQRLAPRAGGLAAVEQPGHLAAEHLRLRARAVVALRGGQVAAVDGKGVVDARNAAGIARQRGGIPAQAEAAAHGGAARVLPADAARGPPGADAAGIEAVFDRPVVLAADAARGVAGGRHVGGAAAQADGAVVLPADAAGGVARDHACALHHTVFNRAVVLRADRAHIPGACRVGIVGAQVFQPHIADHAALAELSDKPCIAEGEGLGGGDAQPVDDMPLPVKGAGIDASALTAADGGKHLSGGHGDVLCQPGIQRFPARGGRLLGKPEQLPRVADLVHAVGGLHGGLEQAAVRKAVLIVGRRRTVKGDGPVHAARQVGGIVCLRLAGIGIYGGHEKARFIIRRGDVAGVCAIVPHGAGKGRLSPVEQDRRDVRADERNPRTFSIDVQRSAVERQGGGVRRLHGNAVAFPAALRPHAQRAVALKGDRAHQVNAIGGHRSLAGNNAAVTRQRDVQVAVGINDGPKRVARPQTGVRQHRVRQRQRARRRVVRNTRGHCRARLAHLHAVNPYLGRRGRQRRGGQQKQQAQGQQTQLSCHLYTHISVDSSIKTNF